MSYGVRSKGIRVTTAANLCRNGCMGSHALQRWEKMKVKYVYMTWKIGRSRLPSVQANLLETKRYKRISQIKILSFFLYTINCTNFVVEWQTHTSYSGVPGFALWVGSWLTLSWVFAVLINPTKQVQDVSSNETRAVSFRIFYQQLLTKRAAIWHEAVWGIVLQWGRRYISR